MEFARSIGRIDWWRVRDEHTAYQWACLIAAHGVCPLGERRADLRAALHTTVLRKALAVGESSDTAASLTMLNALNSYLPCDKEQVGLEVNAAALAQLKGA